jgi:folate-binding protein YgfZ
MTHAPSFAEIEVRGSDAATYLQSQLANDVRDLNPGQWSFGSYCLVDGRVQSLFLCARVDADAFRLLLPQDNAPEVEQRLLRYKVRARCTVATTPVTIAAAPVDSSVNFSCAAFDWHVGPRDPDATCELPDELWDAQLALGIPWLTAPVGGKFLPTMLALERLQAFSLKKGCFPGQEIVARTHYLGRSKRRLIWLLEAPGATGDSDAGAELYAVGESNPCGSVVARAGTRALAVVGESVVAGSLLAATPGTAAIEFVIDRNVDAETLAGVLNGRVGGA